ncbi:MAG: DUF2490 domain-containing protein [Candidatus Omnitrophica bacterium]|nr:DUF2490 domain-containing protein [Candidatus Omnitrophota bacterium]
MIARPGAVMMFFCLIVTLSFPPASRADSLLLLPEDVQAKLSPRWEAKLEVESKYRNDMSEYYDLEFMPWVAYRFTDWFKLGMGWRELYSRKAGSHNWDVEHRPLTDFMFSKKLDAWKVEDRIRVEHRDFEHTKNYYRYRNRLRLTAPWAWTRRAINPWVAWETYYEDCLDRDSDRWNRNRYFVGLGAKLSKSVKVGCYHYWERVLKSGVWKSNNELGFDISLMFDFSRASK